MSTNERFILIEDNEQYPIDKKTCWYWDTQRPGLRQPYIAVQCYRDRNPNDFVRCEKMRLLFTDEAEYYAVCESCYYTYADMQWSGGTSNPGWRDESREILVEHQQLKGWCEFCDPAFGYGGWSR